MHKLKVYCRITNDLPSEFKGEFNNLLCILFFFSSTYLLRFLSGWFITPFYIETNVSYYSPRNCLIWAHSGGEEAYARSKCLPFEYYMYYLPIMILYDFFPIMVILYFHHNTFKYDSRSRNT